MTDTPSAEDILVKIANDKSYESWGELMYDTHEDSQIEYTKEAMIKFARLQVIAELKQHVEHPTKPGYKRSDIVARLNELVR